MSNRHAYLVIQDDRDWPVTSHNDTQRHVLGVHSNLQSAMTHARSFVSSRVERGYYLLRETPYKYQRGERANHEHRERSFYLAKDRHHRQTSEITVERFTITNNAKAK